MKIDDILLEELKKVAEERKISVEEALSSAIMEFIEFHRQLKGEKWVQVGVDQDGAPILVRESEVDDFFDKEVIRIDNDKK